MGCTTRHPEWPEPPCSGVLRNAEAISPPEAWPVQAGQWVPVRTVGSIAVPEYREVMWKGGAVYCVRHGPGLPRNDNWACIDGVTQEITSSCDGK